MSPHAGAIKELWVRRRDKFHSQFREHNMMYEVLMLVEMCNFIQTELVNNERCTRSDECMTKQEWLEHQNWYVLKFGQCGPIPHVGLYIETKRPA